MRSRYSPLSGPAGPPRTGKKTVSGPTWPKEHGAWGILLGSFFTASVWAGGFDLAAILLLLSFTSFYFFHPVFLLILYGKARSADWLWGGMFLALGWGLLLIAGATYRPIVPLSLIMAVFLLLEALLIRHRRHRTLPAQLIGTVGLTVIAPLTVILSGRALVLAAGFVWLLVVLFFSSGILFARFQISKLAGSVRRTPAFRRGRAGLLIFHLLLAGALTACFFASGRQQLWPVAFIPTILISLAAVLDRFPDLSIKQTGWLIMIQTGLFIGLLWIFF
jgi:hypothetical protein